MARRRFTRRMSGVGARRTLGRGAYQAVAIDAGPTLVNTGDYYTLEFFNSNAYTIHGSGGGVEDECVVHRIVLDVSFGPYLTAPLSHNEIVFGVAIWKEEDVTASPVDDPWFDGSYADNRCLQFRSFATWTTFFAPNESEIIQPVGKEIETARFDVRVKAKLTNSAKLVLAISPATDAAFVVEGFKSSTFFKNSPRGAA